MKKVLFIFIFMFMSDPVFSKSGIKTYVESVFEEEDGADYYPEEDQFVDKDAKSRELRKKITRRNISLEDHQRQKTEIIEKYVQENNSNTGEVFEESNIDRKLIERVEFSVVEYNRLKKKGNNRVVGTIYIKGENGSLFVAKDARIFLNPKTSYSEQWYIEAIQKKNKLTPADKRLYNYLVFSTSSKKGSYYMNLIPDGTYYISFSASCFKRCGNKRSIKYYGAAEMTVSKDITETVSMTLSRY